MNPKALRTLARLVDLRQRKAEADHAATTAALRAVAAREASLSELAPGVVAAEDTADPSAFAVLVRRESWRDQRRAALAAARRELTGRTDATRAHLVRARGEVQAVAALEERARASERRRAARRAEQEPVAPVTGPDERFR